MSHSLARKSRAALRSISCSSLKPKSMTIVSSRVRRSGRPRLPEVVVEPARIVQAPERELQRHVDGERVRVAVGELQIDAAAAVEIDDGVRHRRIERLVYVVDGVREDAARST